MQVVDGAGVETPDAARFAGSDGSTVSATRSGGLYKIRRADVGDRLRIAVIGYQPQQVSLDTESNHLTVSMSRLVPILAELSVGPSQSPVRQSRNTWTIDGDLATAVPMAVEPDVFRVLSIAPSVSFASIRSSRPLIRGVDADDTGFSIDGHEVVNLYHIGRSFSGFPAIAAQQVSVATQPARIDIGHTTSGRVEIAGLEWQPTQRSEIQYGLGAWSGVTGWQGETGAAVLAMRTIAGSVAGDAIASQGNDLNIQDLYGRFELKRGLPVTLTVFRSLDRGHDSEPKVGESAMLNWSTSLIGLRTRLLEGSRFGLTASASYSSHTERGDAIPARRTLVDLDNEHERISGKLDGNLLVLKGGPQLRFGVELSERRVRNVIVSQSAAHFRHRSLDQSGAESAGYAELEAAVVGGTLRGGVRVDRTELVSAVQPRVSFARPFAGQFWFNVGVGRSARLIHQVSDAGVEPKVGYYDIWLLANGQQVPVARSDHFTFEVGWQRANNVVRAGVFTSKGEGVMDLGTTISSSTQVDPLRAGESRVVGAELEAVVGSANGRWHGQMSYALVRSERDWGEGWVPWVNDRRHQLRINGSFMPASRTTISQTLELSSGQPYTPFLRIEKNSFGVMREAFGAENGARGRSGLRLGAAVQQELSGPLGTDLMLGFSVTNIGIGDQAARQADVRIVEEVEGGPLLGALPSSRQVSELPVIPSVLLQVRF